MNFIPTIATDLVGRMRSGRIGAWRWYSPGSVTTEGGSEDLPESVVPELLRLTRFASMEELLRELNQHQPHELPQALQKRLLRIASANVCEPWMFRDEDLNPLRPLELMTEDAEINCPFPCKPVLKPRAALDISSFSIEEGSARGLVRISARIGVHTNNFLAPRTSADRDFCVHFLLGTACYDEEMTDPARKALVAWLTSSGLSLQDAKKASEDLELRTQLSQRIESTIEELIDVGVNEGLHPEGDALAINGEQETGFAG